MGGANFPLYIFGQFLHFTGVKKPVRLARPEQTSANYPSLRCSAPLLGASGIVSLTKKKNVLCAAVADGAAISNLLCPSLASCKPSDFEQGAGTCSV